ncbi:hypothetical protein EVG20_g4916 [Dentipellis fragilis]|uniref:CoA-transferase family III n=1 Tax=Dentipellis fragilis TaxID=205917 RepID=A0A4Y9YWP7_9AGAM|nr:hypothetical protein EVG20_g4916 [Dentipellis fragilis]
MDQMDELMSQIVTGEAKGLWIAQGLPPDALVNLHLSEAPDPAVNSSYKLGTTAQTSIGLSALAAAHFHSLRTGEEQEVSVNARHACIEFNSEKYYTVDGKLPEGEYFDELSEYYKTKNGFIRLHTNFPHLKQGLLEILQCPPDKASVTEALSKWDALEFEAAARAHNLPAGALRTPEETDNHEHARTIVNVPPVHIRKIGNAPKKVIPDGAKFQHALEGIRVLDLTWILGGPVGGRTLAAHGADVLHVTSPNLHSEPLLDTETSRGKRTTQLDLNTEAGSSTLWGLVKEADVFLQSYRPNSLAQRGFGPNAVAEARPGIVYASLSGFGHEGPLNFRRGFDSLMQVVGGMSGGEADAYRSFVEATGGDASNLPPYRDLPMQALEHASGFLLAYGIIAALCRTITEGGSWEVNVSLVSTLFWIRSMEGVNPVSAFRYAAPLPPRALPFDPEMVSLSTEIEEAVADDEDGTQPRRKMSVIRHAATLSKTPVLDGTATMRLDANKPVWLPRAS